MKRLLVILMIVICTLSPIIVMGDGASGTFAENKMGKTKPKTEFQIKAMNFIDNLRYKYQASRDAARTQAVFNNNSELKIQKKQGVLLRIDSGIKEFFGLGLENIFDKLQ